MARWVFFAALLAGCIDVPSSAEPECSSTSDCDADHGEVCQEGTCWGNPPGGAFAAVVSAPNARMDLVSRELTSIELPADGWMGDVPLDAAVTFNGSLVEACPAPMTDCDPTTIGATITVARPSLFAGGPGFRAVVAIPAGQSSFSIPVAPTLAGQPPYTITIVPSGRGDAPGDLRSSATLVPPLRYTLEIAASTANYPIELGGDDLPVVTGAVLGAGGAPLAGYRVVALGRWDAAATPQEVSTVAHTGADGAYSITLSAGLVGTVELVAIPPSSDTAAVLHLGNVDAKHSSVHALAQPLDLGHPFALTVPVFGVDGSGALIPIMGARVSLSTSSTTGAGTGTPAAASATLLAEGTTDAEGKASVMLLDGTALNANYRLSITPPASAALGAVFAMPLTSQGVLAGITAQVVLPARLALRGTVTDASGEPLGGVSVTVHPSLRFAWSLAAEPQAFVAAIPAATALTPENGEFLVWVDPNIADTWGAYDLVFEPPPTVRAPAWTKSNLEVPRDSSPAVALGAIALPDAAYVHGRIVDPSGVAIAGAELKLYTAAPDETDLCAMLTHAPTGCPVPAQVQGRGTADDSGTVRLTLPRAP